MKKLVMISFGFFVFMIIFLANYAVAQENLSPLKQLRVGVTPSYVQCYDGLQLILRAGDNPACVKPSTSKIFSQKGWATTVDSKPNVVNTTKLPSTKIDFTYTGRDFDFSLSKYYELEQLNITSQVPQYVLPISQDKITNYANFSSKIVLDNDALELLNKNGFVIIDNPYNPKEEDITAPYRQLYENEVPIFVTTDSLLHLYHIQFDETLRQIEEKRFYDDIWDISKTLLEKSVQTYESIPDGEVKDAARLNTVYLAVGLSLLEPKSDQICKSTYECEKYFLQSEIQKYSFDVPDFVSEQVSEELRLIEEHQGFSESPTFKYNEDYSQYVTRGHYTRSEKLKNYFEGMMWYGRISFLIKGDSISNGEQGAKTQTIGASLIASEFSQNEDLRKKWDTIYTVTAFYVGLSDDLGPYQYIDALNKSFGPTPDIGVLSNQEKIDALKIEFAKLPNPKIYGGTGECTFTPPITVEKAEKCLEATKGMRLMGQRFIPDSYMMSNLVAFDYLGNQNPFTKVETDFGPTRGFPRGLDVIAILGSDRAKELLVDLDDANYKDYDERFIKLKDEFDGFNQDDWNKNLYWSWLYSLKPLLSKFGDGYPTFMQTAPWHDKSMNTALASWSQLRHDTILYAKQSHTMTFTSVGPPPPPPKPVVGYVEPVPEFYNRLLSLTKMTNQGLTELDVLDEYSKSRLASLETILHRLRAISIAELENKELTEDDYQFIKNFGAQLNGVIANVDNKAKKTTIIADVHTDQNSGQVLEEGTGYVKMMVVAYIVPDGRILVGAGPVLSYYEFKQPMNDRLTDEKWRDMLNSNPPNEPEWTMSFIN